MLPAEWTFLSHLLLKDGGVKTAISTPICKNLNFFDNIIFAFCLTLERRNNFESPWIFMYLRRIQLFASEKHAAAIYGVYPMELSC